MKNFRTSLDVLFRRVSFDEVLKVSFEKQKRGLSWEPDETSFVRHAMAELDFYSYNEVRNIFGMTKEEWAVDLEPEPSKPSVFHLLASFTMKTLVERAHEPLVRYEQLLRWRMITHKLGEDLFTTAYFAYRDSVSGLDRKHLSWRPVIATDNLRLKNLLQQGVAENHFHLKGSAPHFHLNWAYLMNHIEGRKEEFEYFEQGGKLEKGYEFTFEGKKSDLYTSVKKAAYIRAYLYSQYVLSSPVDLEGEVIEQKRHLMALNGNSHQEEAFYLNAVTGDLQRFIERLSMQYGRVIGTEPVLGVADYAIPKNVTTDNTTYNLFLYGERHLLYALLKKIYEGSLPEYAQELFYAYLLLKERFREELIQINKDVGFENFFYYQNRKEAFIWGKPLYQHILHSMAIHSSTANQEIQSFETRIAPPFGYTVDPEQLSQALKVSDQASNPAIRFTEGVEDQKFLNFVTASENQQEAAHFYVLHFIKKGEKLNLKGKWNKALNSLNPRNHLLRKEVEAQAKSLMEMRRGLSPQASRVFGIDAAASEFSCRPEVFAQAFRYLKNHRIDSLYGYFPSEFLPEIPQLWATYHAGEDFYDIADGLRAIDECLFYFGLRHGDRLGHALALGLDAKEYYVFKNHQIVLSKQELLDNIAWVLAKSRTYNLPFQGNLIHQLEFDFRRLFHELYGEGIGQPVSSNEYYLAWKLRGDDPGLYRGEDFTNPPSFNYWDRCRKNRNVKLKALRKDNLLFRLYKSYHFDLKAREQGAKREEFLISPAYIQMIEGIQEGMQQELAAKQIGVETNPSSNVLIGTFKQYAKHPIVKFFNMGLTQDYEQLAISHQLFVSINTDDQGVFGTYLENEYALMALALEKEVDESGKPLYKPAMIYEWLDKIRRMGLEQSFKGP